MKGLLRNRWFWRFVGAIVLGLVIYFVGPLIAVSDWRPLGWWVVALLVALLPLIVVGVLWLLSRRRDKKRNADMVDALKPDPGSLDRDELAGKLDEALDQLKTTRLGSRQSYVYQLPWYAIIGPSGAGKTTALLNSGLNFPTAVAGEYRALRGQPNTPNCDWWFTDEAVLIDTAGRYVTQDIDAEADAAGWKAFLELLKQHRPLQPLNGIIVAVPAPDLADAAKMAAHAQNIRARLAETGNVLGLELPVYLLITKADLLAGFREFFARSTDEESDQVFGSTAPGDAPDDAAIVEGFDALVTSVSARVIDRMQNEPQLPRRGQIAGFPGQLASLRKPLAKLLDQLGQKSRFDTPVRVRGVYLASGTQTGNPVDRILLNVGMPATASSHAVGQGRSYFLRRFFSDLIVPEQGLAGRNPLAERKARQRYSVAVAASLAALFIAFGIWGWGYLRNAALIDKVYALTSAYSQVAGESRGGSSTVEQDLAALGVLADGTRDMQQASDFGLGLGQGGRLGSELRGLYGRDLGRRLTPLLVGLAEERMQADVMEPTALYDDLKSYLILGGQGPEMAQHVVAWVQPAWTARASGPEGEAGELARHTAALFDGSFKPVAINDGRIQSARAVLRAQPAAVRVYGRLKSEALRSGEPMWTARDNAGPRPEVVFDAGGAFAPGAGVPALFTRRGYDRLFVPIVARGPQLLKEENWVVGDSGRQQLSAAEIASLRGDLERLYFAEFLDRWQSYLGTVQLKPAGSLGENVQRLRDAGGPASPVAPLLRAVAKATDMTPSASVPKPAGGLIGQALGAAGLGDAAGGARAAVVQGFLPLRMFVGKGQGAPIDALLMSFTQLADKLNVIAVLPGGGGETGSAQSIEAKALILQLEQTSNSLPAPANLWTKAIASDANVALGGTRLAQMGSALNANFGEQCQQALARAYPVQPAAVADMPLPTFAQLFSPQGAFAAFVSKELSAYLDTTKPVWELKEGGGEIGLTEANVRALQAANVVTRTFFATDPQTPKMSYQIEPVSLIGAETVSLQIDGQQMAYDGKAPIPATFEWPGQGGAAVQFRTGSNAPVSRAWTGPWALFRLMKFAAISAGPSPSIGAGSLTQGGARFDFRVRTFGTNNPFVVDPFVKVACPAMQIAAGGGASAAGSGA